MNTWRNCSQPSLTSASISTSRSHLHTHTHSLTPSLPHSPCVYTCRYVETELLAAEGVEEKVQKQFICRQLLSILAVMDLSDEVGRCRCSSARQCGGELVCVAAGRGWQIWCWICWLCLASPWPSSLLSWPSRPLSGPSHSLGDSLSLSLSQSESYVPHTHNTLPVWRSCWR